MDTGKLFVIPTPIGNLEDMTFRAINVLKECDLVLAEDTRTSSFLFKHTCSRIINSTSTKPLPKWWSG
jgi:16S rRNA (cytidine1402-2'-O)-methyltransferase